MEAIIKIVPLIQQLVPLDCTISVSDREQILVNYPGKEINLGDMAGKSIPKGSSILTAINSGNLVSTIVPREAYGFLFKATAVPIKTETGSIIGCIALGLSMKNQETLVEAAQAFLETSQLVGASMEEMASAAQELAAKMEGLYALQKEMTKHMERTEKILNIIKKIAANSKLLGLNASIEAAKVGNEGRGFQVVATEIRKMAENSSQSVEEIEEIVETIKLNFTAIRDEVNKVLEISQHQAAAIQETTASVQGLTSYVENIEEIAGKI